MNDNLLVFQNVSKVFRRVGFGFLGKATVQALKDISFSLSSQPEVLALVGESGSGKSTICRLILGLEEPTSGEILYKGKSVSDWLRSNKKEYIKEVQIIFQDPYEVYNPFYRVDRVLWMAIKKFNIASGDEAEILIY
jgi:peptide/nickel transport system ATP-binding protein